MTPNSVARPGVRPGGRRIHPVLRWNFSRAPD